MYSGNSHTCCKTLCMQCRLCPLSVAITFPVTLLVYVCNGLAHTSKGQCHEDFAVLGQFCAKIITLRL